MIRDLGGYNILLFYKEINQKAKHRLFLENKSMKKLKTHHSANTIVITVSGKNYQQMLKIM